MLGYIALGVLAFATGNPYKQRSLPAQQLPYNGGAITLLPGTALAAQAIYKGRTGPVLYPSARMPAAVQCAKWIDAQIALEKARGGGVESMPRNQHDTAIGMSPVERITPPIARAMQRPWDNTMITEQPVYLSAPKSTPSLL